MSSFSFTILFNFFHKLADLKSFPIFVVYIVGSFFAFVYPKFTKPLNLKWLLIIYNSSMSLTNAACVLLFINGLMESEYVYQKTTVEALQLPFTLYWISKIIELLDTVFMMLRHKTNQISFLHVYHHSSMVLLTDYAANHSAWPAITPIIALNAGVHVIMYFYYALSAYDSNQPLSWKRRLTEMQILQFIFDMIYAFYGYLYHGFCIYGFLYGVIMIYLFANFYWHAYLKRKKTQKKVN